MDYQGKLYGRVNDTYFDTSHTAKDWDQMLEALKSMVDNFDPIIDGRQELEQEEAILKANEAIKETTK